MQSPWITGSARPFKSALAWMAVPVAAVALMFGSALGKAIPPEQNDHAQISLSMALASHFCGERNKISAKYQIYRDLTARPDLLERPFADVLGVLAGSPAAYCASVTTPQINNENSLMLMTRLGLALDRDLSPAGLQRFLTATRVAMVLVFVFALLVAGASVPMATAVAVTGCAIVRAVGIPLTLYPSVLTWPLMLSGLYIAARTALCRRTTAVSVAAIAGAAGLLTGLAVNGRTSQLPVDLALFGVFVVSLSWNRAGMPRRTALIAVVAFVAGYLAFDQAFIRPLRHASDPNATNYTYHAFAHSLVIGLGVPENELSRKEGIRWDDMVGFALARRVDPNVTFLGPTYEQALLTYYRRLWKRHTALMFDAYWHKLRDAGNEVFGSIADIGSQYGIPRGPAVWLHQHTNGIALMAACFAMFASGLAWSRRTGSQVGFALALVGVMGLTSVAESFLTLSVFVAIYFSPLLFALLFAAIVMAQRFVDMMVGRMAIGSPTVESASR